MPEDKIVRTPYNFVPFSNKVMRRYASHEELPPHDQLVSGLKSGEIHITMTADTPVLVSDGKGQERHFFRAPNGKYAIPGSTIRGMIRQNMQILGFGWLHPGEDFEDVHIMFRDMASKKGSTKGILSEYYQKAFDIKSDRGANGKSISIPRNVRAGYLRKASENYVIQPVKGEYLRVSRNHPDAVPLGDEPSRYLKVAYSLAGSKVDHIRPGSAPVDGMQQGVLLFTGKYVGQKPNHLYLFPEADEEAPAVVISEQDVLSYQEDLETRKNTLKNYKEKRKYWELPEDGEEKPVFYIHHEGHVHFGMSLFLRIAHKHALSEGLPEKQQEFFGSNTAALDYPHAILGFAEADRAYRSRVSVGDFEVAGVPTEKRYRVVLVSPKPSYFPGYVVEGKHYSQEGFQLRGHKLYWLKEAGERKKKTEDGNEEEQENVTSTLHPLAKGTKFHGVIRFKNLHEDELGLLLWCLRLEEGCFQSIGMGKPYGFGRMKLHIDRLLETDLDRLYRPEGLCGQAGVDRTSEIDRFIQSYETYALKLLYSEKTKPKNRKPIRELDPIRDFFYLRSSLRQEDEVRYMGLKEYQNTDHTPLRTVQEFREAEEAEKKAANKKELSDEEKLRQLANMYPSMSRRKRN